MNDRDYVRGSHPPACTCVDCTSRRLLSDLPARRRFSLKKIIGFTLVITLAILTLLPWFGINSFIDIRASVGGLFSVGSPALSHVDSIELYPEEATDMTRSLIVATPKCTGVLTPAVSCTDEITFAFPADVNEITEGMILYDHRTHDIIYLLELENPSRASYKTIRNSDTYLLTEEPDSYSSLDDVEGERRVAIAIQRNAHPENKEVLNTLRTLRDDYKERYDSYIDENDVLNSDIDELLKDIEIHCRQAQRNIMTGQFLGCLEFNPAKADELNGREADLLDRKAELQDRSRELARAQDEFRDYANSIRQSSPIYEEVPRTPNQAGSTERTGTEINLDVPTPTVLAEPTSTSVSVTTTITDSPPTPMLATASIPLIDPTVEPAHATNRVCADSNGNWFREDYWREKVDVETLRRDLECDERDLVPYINGKGDGFGRTPLYYAAWYSNSPEVILLLIDYGSNVVVRAEFDRTPLHLAAWHSKSSEVVQLLIDNGSDIEANAIYNRTPLHFAALYNNATAAQVLIANGANIETRDVSGQTPLRSASSYCHFEVIQLLLENGADAWAKDEYDSTPLDIANDCEAPVLEMLNSFAGGDTR